MGSVPDFKELLTLMIWKHPLSYQFSSGSPAAALNMQITLKYIVQYKDLNEVVRYPYNAGTDITLTLPDDALKTFS